MIRLGVDLESVNIMLMMAREKVLPGPCQSLAAEDSLPRGKKRKT